MFAVIVSKLDVGAPLGLILLSFDVNFYIYGTKLAFCVK